MVERSYKYLSEIQLNSLKGFGDKRYSSLKKSGLFSITDLLRFYPRKHIDRSKIKKINEINLEDVDKEVTLIGSIEKISVFTTKSRLRITTLIIKDADGKVNAKWFGPQYIETRFSESDIIALSGKPEVKKTGSIEFKNATIEKYEEIEDLNETGAFIPVYPKVENISSNILRKSIKDVLNVVSKKKDKFSPGISDMLPDSILSKYSLVSRFESVKSIHFPSNFEELKKAKTRLILDEFLYLRSIFENIKTEFKTQKKGFKYTFKKNAIEEFIETLPFTLTKSQLEAIEEIHNDLNNTYPMKRLLQGDVGSGKTVVAASAIFSVVKSGYQVALMAPTEVLAEQHLGSVSTFLKSSSIKIHFLTSSIKERKEILEDIENGVPALYIGTHSLIQEKIKFSNLGLVVIDEQQRFGVDQRKKLIEFSIYTPDQLVMTATPIPRTTALSIYGDLDISSIKELPPGRKEILSHLYNGLKEDNEKVYEKCEQHLNNSSQIFVVCPFIEESENLDIQAAENVYKEYLIRFSNKSVVLLHGKMTYEEKEKIMIEMNKSNIDILISTVVIEVGIDIPNATLMIIESAERFGLNQLHQLRGRVGRGREQSECIFHITKKKTLETITEDGRKRLEAISTINDGFKLSEIDLEIRGEGKVTGTNQSGKSDLKLADLRYDYDLLMKSKEIYDELKSSKSVDLIYEEAKLLFPDYIKADRTT